jgi:hypothetical protein
MMEAIRVFSAFPSRKLMKTMKKNWDIHPRGEIQTRDLSNAKRQFPTTFFTSPDDA